MGLALFHSISLPLSIFASSGINRDKHMHHPAPLAAPSRVRSRSARLTLQRALSICAVAGSVLLAGAAAAAPSVVQTEAGALQGVAAETGTAFFGIPFAAPPIGSLRWKAPAPVAPWVGIRMADHTGPACKQDSRIPPAGMTGSSEDCLYLNVHVPAGTSAASKLPVMVWIHGGAYLNGSGSQYDGDRLANSTQTIVVTLNYRLGIFGLLALDALTTEAPAGNYALQDQQAALGWVHRNITAFGGDASRVTIFGQSAGGASVCQQLVSPSSAGLFQRAILQSGPCTFGTKTRDQAVSTGNAFAAKLGCASGAGQLVCLRGKSADEVLAAAPSLSFSDLRSLQVLTPWVDGAVLPADPKTLVRQGRFQRVPVMLGNTHDEGRLFVALAYDVSRGSPLTQSEYEAAMAGLAGNPTIGSLITQDYSSMRLGSPDLALSAILTDSTFACGTQLTARALSGYVPTYAYQFEDDKVPPLFDDPFMPWGSYHGAELPFVFQSRIVTNPPSPDPKDVASPAQLALSAQMAKYWGRFAATGNPNAIGLPLWSKFNAVGQATLRLNTAGLSLDYLGGIYNQHQCLLWDTAAALGAGV